jgi:4-alpha-glucanotransferase
MVGGVDDGGRRTMSSDLDALAQACGIAPAYLSAEGKLARVPDATKRKFLELLGVDAAGQPAMPQRLVQALDATPEGVAQCFVPEFLRRGQCWGITCQLYGLRSGRNWGIGDFEDLARLAETVAGQGGDFLGVNPLHALYPAEPERCSPYSPSSRRFLNILYIAPDIEPEFARIDSPQLDRLRRSNLVAYGEVAGTKLTVLEAMFQAFQADAGQDRRGAFEAFAHEAGEALQRHCLFEALHERHSGAPWWEWPDSYHRAYSQAVARFHKTEEKRIAFFAWLQWLADRQLKQAQERARAAGMRIGLYLDMAVGVAPDGAMTWADPGLMVRGVHIGAPPDAFSLQGQDWGLIPQRPTVLIERKLQPFSDDLRASMHNAGAVRLDHAMAVQRLFWIPAGAPARYGTYVRYPQAAMLAAVAEESRRWHCLVIGEALGTVPDGFLDLLAEKELQSYRVLFFERQGPGGFRPPADYPPRAFGCVSTHDLPTLLGWWTGRDIEWRHEVDFVTPEEAEAQRRDRSEDRVALWNALVSEDLVTSEPVPGELDANAVIAVHRYVAKSPVRLMGVQLEDATGEREQPNVPGASEPHPNWRRKLSVGLEDLAEHPLFKALCAAMAAQRPRR